MGRRKRDYVVGEVCFAQVKGFPFWPAKVEATDLEKRTVEVIFFGTGERAKCKVTNAVLDYGENREAFGQKKLKGAYLQALVEADTAYETAPRHPEAGGAADKGKKRTAPAAKEPKAKKAAKPDGRAALTPAHVETSDESQGEAGSGTETAAKAESEKETAANDESEKEEAANDENGREEAANDEREHEEVVETEAGAEGKETAANDDNGKSGGEVATEHA